MQRRTLLVAVALTAALATVPCGEPHGYSCPDKNTCCLQLDNPDHKYGCVPSEAGIGDAVCCQGGTHACPANYTCASHGSDEHTCVSASGPRPDPTLSADWPYPMGMAGWQPSYSPCPAFLGTGAERSLTVKASGASKLVFSYYSNVLDLGSTGHEDVEVALVVQHGAGRNADDYYCSGLQAAALHAQEFSGKVAVVAPRFMEAADLPGQNVAWWNGSDPVGYWRAGAESDPTAAADGSNTTVSSFAVLDQIISALATDRVAYPKLRRVVIMGHSSGGQIVQRHALFTRLPAAPPPTAQVRHVVANPSSFAYLDEQRWLNGSLRRLTAAERTACPLFDDWQFGFAAGLPPFCAAGNATAAAAAAVAAYPTRDVVYLQGGNDTCNEAFVPGCVSHGLETTCMDMLEGRFRLERGQRYKRYLDAFYGKPTHSLFVVPDVGHDHSLIWDSSLQQIFG